MKARTVVTLVAVGLALLVAMACEHDDSPSPDSAGSAIPDKTPTAGVTAASQATQMVTITATREPTQTAQPAFKLDPTPTISPAAAPTQEEGDSASGIQGQALMGPMCPVVRSDEPCPDQPIRATIDVWNVDRTLRITSFTTDVDGRFRVTLLPGEYLLEPRSDGPGGLPFAKPVNVVVQENAYTTVAISYDTGIR